MKERQRAEENKNDEKEGERDGEKGRAFDTCVVRSL